MNRRKITLKTIPLLLGAGLVLSACTTTPDYDAAAYPDSYAYQFDAYAPILGGYAFEDGGFSHYHHDRDFGYRHDGHSFAHHAGEHFARIGGQRFAGIGGHGFASRGSFGGHGGAGRG